MEINTIISALTALAQATRLDIYRLLVQADKNGLSVNQIKDHIKIPSSSLSFHLKELCQATLISRRNEGRFIFYSANHNAMRHLIDYLTENCCGGSTCMLSKQNE